MEWFEDESVKQSFPRDVSVTEGGVLSVRAAQPLNKLITPLGTASITTAFGVTGN